jgi:hypothetical protein
MRRKEVSPMGDWMRDDYGDARSGGQGATAGYSPIQPLRAPSPWEQEAYAARQYLLEQENRRARARLDWEWQQARLERLAAEVLGWLPVVGKTWQQLQDWLLELVSKGTLPEAVLDGGSPEEIIEAARAALAAQEPPDYRKEGR